MKISTMKIIIRRMKRQYYWYDSHEKVYRKSMIKRGFFSYFPTNNNFEGHWNPYFY